MRSRVADAELALNDTGDSLAGPHLTAEAVSLSTSGEQLRKTSECFGWKLRLSAWDLRVAQRFFPALPGTRQPLAHRALADPKCLADARAAPALLVQFESAKAPVFAPVL